MPLSGESLFPERQNASPATEKLRDRVLTLLLSPPRSAAALAAGKEAKKDRQAKKAAAGPKPAQQKLSRTQVGKGAARGGR